jgi:hypothetical protein
MNTTIYSTTAGRHNSRAVPAVELLAEHIRMRALPWPARRLARRHGLKAATARTVAELVGYAIGGRDR